MGPSPHDGLEGWGEVPEMGGRRSDPSLVPCRWVAGLLMPELGEPHPREGFGVGEGGGGFFRLRPVARLGRRPGFHG